MKPVIEPMRQRKPGAKYSRCATSRGRHRRGRAKASTLSAWFSGLGLMSCALSPLETPPGVDCAEHLSCSLAGPCADCVAVPGCGTICIEPQVACELSCPVASQCLILESFPMQLACEGIVPGFGQPQSELSCGEDTCLSNRQYCDVFLPGVPDPTDPNGGVQRECRELPEACSGANADCDCLLSSLGGGSGLVVGDCSGDARSGLTFTLAAP